MLEPPVLSQITLALRTYFKYQLTPEAYEIRSEPFIRTFFILDSSI